MLYKLILVGKPIHDESAGACRILCYFQPWLVAQNIAASEEILSHAINSTFASKLICGTIWIHSEEPDKTNHILPADYKCFTINPGLINAQRLRDLIPLEALSPSKFWAVHNDTWMVCINSNDTKIIIPYFELLRVLFYNISRRLTDFIFSQASINSLCIPIEHPNESNSMTARMCVATTECTSQEARLLGSLLFDNQLLIAFNISQSYWRSALSRNNTGLTDKASTINIGDFDNTSFNASGCSFSYNGEKYFWAHNLEINQLNYKFSTILYYPLLNNKENRKSVKSKRLLYEESELVACPDVLQTAYQYSARPEIWRCLNEPAKVSSSKGAAYMTTIRQWSRAIRNTGLLPLVVRRLPWAKLASRSSKKLFLEEHTMEKHIQQLSIFNDLQSLNIQNFRKLIGEFKAQNYSTKPLALNNPSQAYGKELSVLPVNNYAPLPIILYQNYIHFFRCVEVKLTNAFLYIGQPFPKDNPELFVLFVKQNLIRPTDTEWNTLLNYITTVRSYSGLKPFYSKIKHTQVRHVSSNTAFLAIPVPSSSITATFCIDLINNILTGFRKRLQFSLATSLKYPNGVTSEQQRKIKTLSNYVCRAPDPVWQARIVQLWREATYRKLPIKVSIGTSYKPWKNTSNEIL